LKNLLLLTGQGLNPVLNFGLLHAYGICDDEKFKMDVIVAHAEIYGCLFSQA